MSITRAPVARRAVAVRPRPPARRRSQADSQAVIVALLTFCATGLAVYDLLLLALAAQ